MNRRTWLTSTTAALLATPLWIRQAFARGPACPSPDDRRATLRDALAASTASGKPLLIFTVPVDVTGYARGQAFGEWLNHGSDASLADLAQVLVACASTADLAAQVPGVKPGDPLMRLIEDGKVTALDAPLEDHSSRRGIEDSKVDDRRIDNHIKTLTGLLHAALERTARVRVARTTLLLSSADVRRLEGATRDLDLSLVDRAASLLATLHPTDPAVLALLAKSARKRLVEKPIPGSLWARGSGCGQTIEGVPDEEQEHVKCGMGHVPDRSRRFIRFYACAGQ